jgi:GST-like protein
MGLLGVELELREVEYGIHNPDADALRAVNPLGQVPTLVTDDGQVLTESAAIALWLLEAYPASGLAPPPGDADRGRFLRWLMYFVAAIYPMYTVGDEAAAWVGDEAGPRLQEASVERTLLCWQTLERELAPGTYLLGDRLSVLDLYAAVMSLWRPGRDRIRVVAPRAVAAAERTEAHPVVAAVVARNRI